MKKIVFLIIILISFTTQINAVEKRDCTNIKKISKAYVACKSGNLKASVVGAGSLIKKNTVGKIKNKKTNNSEEISTTSKIVKTTKEKTNKAKSLVGNIFKGSSKQYPRGANK